MDLRSKCHISWDSQWSLLLYLILKFLACEFYPKAATLTATTTITTTIHFVSHPSILTLHHVSTTPHSTLCQPTNCLCQNSNPLKHLLAAVIFYFFHSSFDVCCSCFVHSQIATNMKEAYDVEDEPLGSCVSCSLLFTNVSSSAVIVVYTKVYFISFTFSLCGEKTPSSSVVAPLITISIYFGYIVAQ